MLIIIIIILNSAKVCRIFFLGGGGGILKQQEEDLGRQIYKLGEKIPEGDSLKQQLSRRAISTNSRSKRGAERRAIPSAKLNLRPPTPVPEMQTRGCE